MAMTHVRAVEPLHAALEEFVFVDVCVDIDIKKTKEVLYVAIPKWKALQVIEQELVQTSNDLQKREKRIKAIEAKAAG